MKDIKKINNIELEFYNNSWIIWKSHNKDYTLGSYYRLNSNKTIDLIIETEYNIQVIKNITEVNQ